MHAKEDKKFNQDSTYVHDQSQASAVWNITHGLNKYPSVTVVDSAKDEVVGEVRHLSTNTTQITFSAAFSGQAFLN